MSFKIGKKIFSNLPNSFNPLRKKLAENYSEKKSTKYTDIIENEVSKINNSKLSPYEKRIRKNIIQHVSSAYDERFLIPLIFFGYDTPKGKIISQQVRSIDIFPTVAKIIGMPNPKTIQGRNLFPLIERKNIDELPAYVDSARNHISSATANVVGIRTSKYKYFRNRKLPEKNVHLFDLEKDPKEENNIANEKPEIIKLMETNLEQINDKKSFDFEIADETIDSKEKEEMDKVLRELGYFN